MTDLEIYNIMHPIIATVTGLPNKQIILGDQNEKAPTGEYAAVRPQQTITERGQAIVNRKNSATPLSVDVEVKTQIIAECSLNFYRGNAIDHARKMKQANKRPDVSAALFNGGLGWNRTGPINQLTALQSNQQEKRAQISIFLMYESVDTVTINSIESVGLKVQDFDQYPDFIVDVDVKTNDAP